MPRKVWKKLPTPPPGFASALDLSPFQAHLAYNRGIRGRDQLDDYLKADRTLSHDPMLLPDMEKAVARLTEAMRAGETIGVFGDFDTDGVTGTALMVNALRENGAKVIPYLPDRAGEGHGLNIAAVEALHTRGVSVMVTVDCGVTSEAEVARASELGIDTIITDHHSLSSSMPDAWAVVNPRRPDSRYPYDDLTGAGLSFKLAEGIWASLGLSEPEYLYELAALGTVADVAPLTGENRYLVKKGLEFLNATRHPGLSALIERSGLTPGSLDTESLSFGLIPRLNAAGRIGDASLSLELLTASSDETAGAIAERLESLNNERRRLSKEGIEQAVEQVERWDRIPSIIFVEDSDWISGILGLIAGSLSERYHRPVVAVQKRAEVSRASARSIPEFDIVAALRGSRDVFDRFGGHPRAAGFTVPTVDLPRVKGELTAVADEELNGMNLSPSIDVDCEITPALLDDRNFAFIQSLGPFGEGNRAPVFLTRNARVYEVRQVGEHGDHLKMRLGYGRGGWDAIAFRQGASVPEVGGRVDVVYTAGLDDWGGQPRMQLNVLDFRAGR